jgi:putative endonuclease
VVIPYSYEELHPFVCGFSGEEPLLFQPMKTRNGIVYIMTNATHTVLYTGVTSDIVKRVQAHREHKYSNSFTTRYRVVKLVYYEAFLNIRDAIAREKQIKGGSRQKKLNLINDFNPGWKDLYDGLLD